MKVCITPACGSYAINPHLHGRLPDTDLDLCDVCYWRKRAAPGQTQHIGPEARPSFGPTNPNLKFKIVGVEEGRGKLRGHVDVFICEVLVGDTMTTCAVKLAGDTSVLAQAWQQPDKWIGKMLTVKYQGRTATGSLRFPVGLRLREEV